MAVKENEQTKEKARLTFNEEKCNQLYEELISIFQKHKPTVGEILIAYGNLGYSLGASIGGYEGKGPSIEELKKLYYTYPGRLDLALMLQGITVTTWHRDWEQIQTAEDTNKEG